MKKKALLLFSLLFTLLPVSAFEVEICEGEQATLTASQTGISYQWQKDGTDIKGANEQTYKTSEAGNYSCKITQEGGEEQKFNLVEYGNFDWAPSQLESKQQQTINDPLTGKSYTIQYELQNFVKTKNVDPGHSTTTPNPNEIKSQYFSSITPKGGSHMLACDGGSGEWRVWNVRNMKLKKGQEYQFSCWAANIDKEYFSKQHGPVSLPKIAFIIETQDGKQELGVGFMTLSENLGAWEEFKATYTSPKDYDWAHLYIINKTAGAEGNDFTLDEVYFGAVPTSTKVVTDEFKVIVKSCGNPPIIHLVQNVCLGASYVLEAETKDADQYLWENGDTGKQVTWVAESIGDFTYKCTVTLENGTTIEESFPVHVELCSDVQEFFETICQGEEYTFHEEIYTLPGDYEYKYTTPEGIKMTEILHLSVNEPSIVEFTDSICQGEAYKDYGFSFTSADTQNPGSYDFMNNGINVGGCDSTTILHLDIFPLPVFETKVEIQTMEVQVNVGTEPFLYTLDDGQGFTTNYFEKLTVGKHTIQVTDAHQCSSSQEFEIESIPLKPNVYFSPNGDGNHDLWNIEGIEFYPNAIIQIYDRNNKQIAHFLVPEFKGWDGQYNGHGMPADDYWYLLTVPELGKQYSGHFTLKR